MLLVAMCAGYFLVLLDVTIVNVALPSIGSGLGADVSDLQWVVDGYAIALASLMLVGGAVGDLHGHRRIVLVGLGVFGVASLACGAAPSAGLLVGARVLQGVGAALLLPGTLAIISHAFPEPGEQAKAIGIWAGIGSLALPAGPLLGGALADAFGRQRRRRGHEPRHLGHAVRVHPLPPDCAAPLGLAAGVAMLPLFLPLTVLAPLAGRLTAHVGPKLPMAAGLLTAAVGVGLLVRAQAGSGYRTLLPALLLWGIGLGVLTPAVVAAAVRAVPARRAGLASAVNNTARQAGGAIGIAAFGAIAGSAAQPGPSSPVCTPTRSSPSASGSP